MTIYLVRHAKARDRQRWAGRDELRPLSAAGREQAQRLVGAIGTGDIELISSSPSVRCVQTVEPLADARGLEVNRDDALAEGGAGKAIDLVKSLVGVEAVLCSHGDVIPEVLQALADGGAQILDGAHWQKGSVWVLHTDDGRFSRATYIPAAK